MSDELDDFGLPGRSLDDFLAEEFRASTDETPEEQSDLPVVHDFNPDADRELTLYGVMRLAAEAAVDAVSGYKLSPQADAFRAYLVSFRNELRS